MEYEGHSHQSSEREEHCSPFCVCDCCSSNIAVQLEFYLFRTQITEIFPATQKPYSDLYSPIFQNRLLQPPRGV